MKNIYITTPIYYCNDKPHIGHAYTTILADVISKYHNLLGNNVHFLTGVDEHGQKIEETAKRNKISPKEQCDLTAIKFQDLWGKLDINYSDFIRTTEKRHTSVVEKILLDLYTNGDIYKAEYNGLYCIPCESFFTHKDLKENKCLYCNREVEEIRETNYFFRLSKYQDWLINHIQNNEKFILPKTKRNETLGFLNKPLNDLCISRPKQRVSWGIELPFDSNYVTYVWFDALINYISAIKIYSDSTFFNTNWPAKCHIIGKDILIPHTVYWPIILKALDLKQPTTILVHGWWLLNDNKVSKSVGNIINPIDYIQKYFSDAFRYFLLKEMKLGNDCNFSNESFDKCYNTDLANTFGNLVNRVIKLALKNCNGELHIPLITFKEDIELYKAIDDALINIEKNINNYNIDLIITDILNILYVSNKYIDILQPWKLAKNNKIEELNTVLYNTAHALYIVSILLSPLLPIKTKELQKSLGISSNLTIKDLHSKLEYIKIIDIPILFPKIIA